MIKHFIINRTDIDLSQSQSAPVTCHVQARFPRSENIHAIGEYILTFCCHPAAVIVGGVSISSITNHPCCPFQSCALKELQ